MITFITENIGTILVGAIVFGIVAWITVSLIRNKRKGKTSCGCGCENCPSASICHK